MTQTERIDVRARCTTPDSYAARPKSRFRGRFRVPGASGGRWGIVSFGMGDRAFIDSADVDMVTDSLLR